MSLKAKRRAAYEAFINGEMKDLERYWYNRRRTSGSERNLRRTPKGRSAIKTDVYIFASDAGFIKVGSSIDVDARFRGIDTAVPFQLSDFARVTYRTGQMARFIEYKTQRLLKRFHVKGEWFSCSPLTACKALSFAHETWGQNE